MKLNQIVMTIMSVSVLATGCCDKKTDNPLLQDWNTPFGTAPFEKIKTEHYLPAFKEAITQHNQEIDAIINQKEEPNFENTIAAYDFSGRLLAKINGVFYNMTEANTSKELQAVQDEVAPLLTAHRDSVAMNPKLFERVKKVKEKGEPLNREQQMLLDKIYKSFVRNGALLPPDQQEELKKTNAELAGLCAKFESNLLEETKSYKLVIDRKEDLAGLPQWLIEQGATTAKANNMSGKWIYTLDNPSVLPFLQYADNRALREQIFNARINRCNNNNAFDNKETVSKIVNLRAKKAEILGYANFAEYVLEERMAKKPEAVFDLLKRLNETALAVAKNSADKLYLPLLKKDAGDTATLQGWDMYYYAEKYRKEHFNFDEEQTRPYLEINNVRQGCFDVITKLYGLTFTQRNDISVYADDVSVFEVKTEKGEHAGILYFDPYTRASKTGGAWCNEYRGQYVRKTTTEERTTPIITVCFNFSKGAKATHLTADEAATVFHEMGHAVHQFLSNCTYPSVSGTNVPTDFVELPSQVFEHWFSQKEVLQMFARNDKGEIMPDSLIAKMDAVATFNQDFMLTELVSAAYLDMAFHSISSKTPINTLEFEANAMATLGCISQIPPRYRSTYFAHIFGGDEYSAGYYSYIWSEVLDADAFAAFLETGNIFDNTTANRFKKEILSNGGKEEADVMYRNFRGRDADPEYILIQRGLLPSKK
ncbi:MAG: M3 family metallopeptidase [Bacteroidales bacterium]|jgi:peptidyl-dipeptidase Dcp|nr:M3 family metallopeptidase [Bacteroidales bacterium]